MIRPNFFTILFSSFICLIFIISCGGGSNNNTTTSESTATTTTDTSDTPTTNDTSNTSQSTSSATASGNITWTNSTFGVSGNIGITVQASGTTLTSLGFSSDFDGSSDTISGLSVPFADNDPVSVTLTSAVYGQIELTFFRSSGRFSATRQDSLRGTISYEGTYSVSGNTLTINGTFSVPTFSATGPFSGSITGEAISLLL